MPKVRARTCHHWPRGIACGEAARRNRETLGDPEFGPWLAQASILVIDDEPGMRNFLVRTLGPRCKRIEEAVNTQEASRKLDANYFDVVILTISCRAGTGSHWLSEQRTIGFFADAILITAYADLVDRHPRLACWGGRFPA